MSATLSPGRASDHSDDMELARPRRAHNFRRLRRWPCLCTRRAAAPLLLLLLLHLAFCAKLALREVQARWHPPKRRAGSGGDSGSGGGSGGCAVAPPCGAYGCIPRHIHQMFASAELPERWRGGPAAWRAHHPGWNYTIWTDLDLRLLVANSYPWLLPTYATQ